MKLGEVSNAASAPSGKPLDGVRVLALEQMQALPYATQLLARLGADVTKVEPPGRGDSSRSSQPAMMDADGRAMGATFLRNNLNKRSVTIDLKHPEGRELVLRLAPRFDVVAENFKAGTLDRLGLGYADIARVHPACIHVSVSGFGSGPTPYASWPAFSSVVEAMSGIYDVRREGDSPPMVNPMGAIGDISAALFATIGVLAALLHRQRTGEGQHVDIAMLDSMVAMTDIVANFWSMGLRDGDLGARIMDAFRTSDGWFVLQVVREHQFVRLAELVGRPEWKTDRRFATRAGWIAHLDDTIRPAIETWAADRSKREVCDAMAAAGLAAGPCFSPEEVVTDPHLAARSMLVEVPRPDGVAQPVLVPGNPVKLSKVAEGPDTPHPRLGQDTDAVLSEELGLTGCELDRLRAESVIDGPVGCPPGSARPGQDRSVPRIDTNETISPG